MDKEELKHILDGIHHYWFKGYIHDEELFRFIDWLVLAEKDPFQKESFLRILVINCIYNTRSLQNQTETNGYFSGYTIDKEKIDQIWITEYTRLQKAIGKKKYNDKCGGCGKKITSVVKIITPEDITHEYYRENVGRVCWLRKCTCPHNDQEIIEIDHEIKGGM